MRVIDLSEEIYQGMATNPKNVKTIIWEQTTHESTVGLFEDGLTYSTNGIILCDHGPTHVDALSCFAPGLPSMEEMPLDLFFGPGTCVDISHVPPLERMNAAQFQDAVAACGAEIREGDVLLIHTGAPGHSSEYPGIDGSATEWIIDQGIKIFGIDAESPDTWLDRRWDSHTVCKNRGITHYEHLTNLAPLIGKRFMFYGFPLKIRAGTGSPVRAVAVLDD